MDVKTIKLIWHNLSELQQLVLQEAVHNQSGHLDMFAFKVKYQKSHPSNGYWSKYNSRGDEQDKILYIFFYPVERYGPMVYNPSDLVRFLKSHIPLPPEFSLKTVNNIDSKEFYIQETQQHIEGMLHHQGDLDLKP
ncbi:hypothetical protein CJF42_16775 [Pseudoalteromonas sp. NBT06-2]|uniref:hypothetical protein n=1 Tax=Pseudoalteromonas sp. NBT06-2 TaxID=2025950 RepID=UPI000BA62DA1|nr:hypothetical protein [Pseudoalteromonas sp. NBT06-2]PAJ73240.1 hypothetical protein CJF42_16775 [Pseudoalteromonas sp. NBT06-2]